MPPTFRYPWPASAIGKEEMKLLYLARESSATPTTITRLIAEAVRVAYSQPDIQPETQPSKESNETVDFHCRIEGRAGRPEQGRQRSRPSANLGLRAA